MPEASCFANLLPCFTQPRPREFDHFIVWSGQILSTTPDVSKHWLISWIILGYSVILVYYSVSYSLICIQFIICWQIVCKWAELYANEASCCPSCYCSIFLPSVFYLLNFGSFVYSRLSDQHWEKFKTNSLLICIQCVKSSKIF